MNEVEKTSYIDDKLKSIAEKGSLNPLEHRQIRLTDIDDNALAETNIREFNNDKDKEKYEKACEVLKSSIKKHGLIQPIIVVKLDSKFGIIEGHSRYKVISELNKEDAENDAYKTIKCIVLDSLTDYKGVAATLNSARIALTEKQREDIIMYYREKDNATITEVAEKLESVLGISRATIGRIIKKNEKQDDEKQKKDFETQLKEISTDTRWISDAIKCVDSFKNTSISLKTKVNMYQRSLDNAKLCQLILKEMNKDTALIEEINNYNKKVKELSRLEEKSKKLKEGTKKYKEIIEEIKEVKAELLTL